MTAMQTITGLVQGSDAWKAFRTEHLVASEAPVIMGASPYMKRDELLNLKTTGDEKEISEWVEKFIFAKGHEYEAQARPIAEARKGEDLFPIIGVREVGGLKLLASFDGTTMFEDDSWEHKTLSNELRKVFAREVELGPLWYWQLEHQMLVMGTDSCIFSASLGTEETYQEMRYESVPERREQLIEGWKLFLADLETYEPKVAKAQLVGKSPMDLPALRIEIEGGVTASNLDAFKQVALDVFGSINTDLKTDEDFANAESTVKWCSGVEDKLDAAKQHALSQTASIDELFRTIDDLREECRKVRLNLDRRVKERKKEVRLEIAQAAKAEFDKHIEMANKALGGDYMPQIPTDFNNAMKGKRTVATLESAANDELARVRIEANRICSRIDENLTLLADLGNGYEFLFADKKALVVNHDKAALDAIAKQRIAEHKAAEDKRIQEEAERIAAEKAQQVQAEQQQAEASTEPTKINTLTPGAMAPAAQATPITEAAQKKDRPSDDEIISVLAIHYRVHESKVIQWLMEMNLRDASTRLVSNL